MSRTDDSPLTLDYASPESPNRYVSMLELAASTAAFAASFWAVEYTCQYLHFFGGSGASLTGFARVRAAEGLEESLMIEAAILFFCMPAFFIVQGLMRPAVAVRVRRYALILSAIAGAAFSLIRWGLDFALSAIDFHMSGGLDFCVAIMLAIVLAIAVARYRWPRSRRV